MVELTIVDKAGVPSADLAAFSRAAKVQADQVRSSWGTPRIQFGSSGWKIVLLKVGDPALHGWLGLHWYGVRPYALVAWTPSWTIIASHEIVEMLANPWTNRIRHNYRQEICDPVKRLTYRISGIRMSDFVTPAWFGGHTAPYDHLGDVTSPFSVQFGYAERGNPNSGYTTVGSGP
jgi:hypothetical protein